jgi:Pup amidohydrolase
MMQEGCHGMSDLATYLKVGTTALVLDMIEGGFVDKDVGLESAVDALHIISRDPSLRARVRLKDGRAYTALEIQLVYLEDVPGTRAPGRRRRDLLARLRPGPAGGASRRGLGDQAVLIERYMTKHACPLEDPRVRLLDLQ